MNIEVHLDMVKVLIRNQNADILDVSEVRLWYSSSIVSGTVYTRLRDAQTCETTLALAYILHHLSAIWSQLQIEERSLR